MSSNFEKKSFAEQKKSAREWAEKNLMITSYPEIHATAPVTTATKRPIQKEKTAEEQRLAARQWAKDVLGFEPEEYSDGESVE
jgi:hypothetical protein